MSPLGAARARGSRPARLTLAVLAVGLVALVLAPGAAAHALLQSSSPRWSAVLSTAPRQVTLYYSEDVAPDLGRISVLGPGGDEIAGAPTYHGSVVVVPVRSAGRGSYTVRWRVVAADDGHTTEGAFSFGVRATPQAPASAPGLGVPALPEILAWLQFVGVVLAGGVLTFRAIVWTPAAHASGQDEPQDARAAMWCAAVGAIVALHAGLFGFLVGAYPIVGGGISSLISTEIIPIRDGTHLGQAFTFSTFAWLVVLAVIVAAWGLPRRREPLLSAAGVLSLAIAFGITWSSHPDSHGTLAVIADFVHLVTAALWAGGVIGLVLVAGSVRAATLSQRDAIARACVVRFSQLAVPLVALLGVAGIYLAIKELPSFNALGTTGWGAVLLGKTAVAFVALAIAGYHHRWVVPRLANDVPMSRLRPTLAAESALLLCVIALAAVLGQIAPPV
jgi:copper transport protein